MDKTLKLVGQSSNEIYVLRYPSALLDFCDYDLSYFAKRAVEACSEAQKTGEIDFDRFAELKRDIQTAHCYIEHHIRTIYEKLPIDCYIDFLCRRDNVGTGTLWNRFISCRTKFEKAVFQRLCEFRYNRAINEWLNILRVRDYAVNKIEFVFPAGIKSAADAAARRNYFDLMFSVTASEMGCRLDKLGETKVFSVGRIPNSPFMFPSISKDIIRNVLADFDYSDDYSDIKDYTGISDEIAMDAFSRMKNGLSAELSSYNILKSKMEKYDKIYMPCSLKAVVDLEIDAIIESGGYLAICPKCKKRYYRGKDYDEDYCNYLHNGKSCLEEYLEENPPKRMTPELEEKSRSVTDEVYSRVGSTMNTKEYENWHSYMTAMMDKVRTGEISPEEFDDFLDYSLTVDISKSKPIVEVPKESGSKERIVKPFVPERIERSSLKKPEPEEPENSELLEAFARQSPKDGFFVSPSVARRTGERRISHIIRAGEPRGEENYTSRPNPADFRPFAPQQEEPKQSDAGKNETRTEPFERRNEPYVKDVFVRSNEDRTRADETRGRSGEDRAEMRSDIPESIEDRLLAELEALRGRTGQKLFSEPEETVGKDDKSEFKSFFEQEEFVQGNKKEPKSGQKLSEMNGKAVREERTEKSERAEKPVKAEKTEREETKPAPRTRVIKKNAAAISAYGRMSGANVVPQPPEIDIVSRAQPEDVVLPEENTEQPRMRRIPSELVSEPDKEPFKDVSSIFDVLENSHNTAKTEEHKESARRRSVKDTEDENEPSPEWEESEEREYPSRITKENAPSGIWTEDRNVFKEEDPRSELDILKEKKHPKSNKTKRLFDVIMREPDDNPNVRRKK